MNEKKPADNEPASGSDFPGTGRLAGIDFGTVRIGISISDFNQSIASPLENYTRRNSRLDDQFFLDLVKQERIVGFVVGLPVHASGDESQKSKQARAFGKYLQHLTDLPVTCFDERFTTAHAETLLKDSGLTYRKRKQRLDKLAAQIMLSAFLESSRNTESTETLEDSS